MCIDCYLDIKYVVDYISIIQLYEKKGRVTVWPFFGPRWIWLKFEYMVV